MSTKGMRKCRSCRKLKKEWDYDGSIIKNKQEVQAYCCKECWDKRTYYVWNFTCKPSLHGVIK